MKIIKKNLTWIFLLFIVLLKLPDVIKNFKMEGIEIPQTQYFDLMTSGPVTFPPPGQSLLIFWASWCSPCHLEMSRLKTSIEEGRIPAIRVFAMNPFEDIAAIKKYLLKNKFPFYFIHSPEIGSLLQVDRTPTTVWTKDGVVTSVNTGISLIGIWKAEILLD